MPSHLGDGLSIAYVKDLNFWPPCLFTCWRTPVVPAAQCPGCAHPCCPGTLPAARPGLNTYKVSNCCLPILLLLLLLHKLLFSRPCHLLTTRWRLCMHDTFSCLFAAVPGLHVRCLSFFSSLIAVIILAQLAS